MLLRGHSLDTIKICFKTYGNSDHAFVINSLNVATTGIRQLLFKLESVIVNYIRDRSLTEIMNF